MFAAPKVKTPAIIEVRERERERESERKRKRETAKTIFFLEMLQVVVERRVRGLYINMEEGSSQARTFNRFNATQPKATKQCFNSMERRT